MNTGRLKRINGTDHFVFVVEEKQGNRVIRRTSQRMKEQEVRAQLKAQGLSEEQVETEMNMARGTV